jgi:RNA polymerase sigma factor (sigma-70 family)
MSERRHLHRNKMATQTQNLSGPSPLSSWIRRLSDQRFGIFLSRRLKNSFFRDPGDLGEEKHLVAEAVDGNARAIKELIRRLKPDMFKVARAISGTQQDPADLAEVMFIRIFRTLNQYPADLPFSDWSMQTAIAIGIRETQGSSRSQGGTICTDDDARLLVAIDRDGDVPAGEASRLLDRVLDRLTPAERLVKRLHALDDQTIATISRWTGWSPSEVDRYLFNADLRIEELLGEICSNTSQRSPSLER